MHLKWNQLNYTNLKLVFGTTKTSLLFFPEFLRLYDVSSVYIVRKTFLKIKKLFMQRSITQNQGFQIDN